MQKATKRVGIALLAACLLAALAFGGVAAWAQDSGLGGENSLTYTVAVPADDEALADVAVTANVYKIGSASKDASYDTYNFTLDEGYAGLSYDLANMDSAHWRQLAQDAAELVNADEPSAAVAASRVTQDEPLPAGEPLENLGEGLYLVVAEQATTGPFTYTFAPTVVSLPTKEPLRDDDGNVRVDEDGYPIIMTSADYGDWVGQAEVTLKYERERQYGNLRIVKTVSNFSGEAATFVFHIQGTMPDGRAYDNYASVYYAGGESAATVVRHIPVGTTLTVTEEYTGARFDYVSGDTDEKTIVADGGDEAAMASASFANTQNDSGKGGHGIQNNFEYSADSGDWEWTSVPAEDHVDQTIMDRL